jgi:hypothetical protein
MMPGMGNRSRRRRRADGTISDARASHRDVSHGAANDPLYGIPDTNMPYLASIRMARALQGRGGWRRWYAVYWLGCLLLSAVGTWLVLALR